MKRLSRILLRAVGVVSPVVIAACYGPLVGFEKNGRAIDATTKAGIAGIQVDCLIGGAVQEVPAITGEQGYFYFHKTDEAPCDQLRFTDTDGEANGGTYQTKTVPCVNDGAEAVVELSK
jgi:hypothetical protein